MFYNVDKMLPPSCINNSQIITHALRFHAHHIVTYRVVDSKYLKITDLIVSHWQTGK